MNPPKILVVARSKRLADQFMRHCLLEPQQWLFASRPEHLLGIEGWMIFQLGPIPGANDAERDEWLKLLQMRGWPRNVVMRLPA